ncbi:MAG: signal peptidase I [Actinomycetota bacterium]|nr:signal peptidase I [Actinomycetota bacterium]
MADGDYLTGEKRLQMNLVVRLRAFNWRPAREWVLIIAVALLAAFTLRLTLIQTYFIPSESMHPTLVVDDRVMVYKLAFTLGNVERGDLVVFNRPPNLESTELKDFVKRVVGLEGETIGARGGVVLVDGRPLDEPYLLTGVDTADFEERVVPEDHVFVMGDNRYNSRDSRFFGSIHKDLLVGEVFLRIWPIKGIGRP